MNIDTEIQNKEAEIASTTRVLNWLRANQAFLCALPDTVEINAGGTYSCWLTVHNREDLQACLAFAPLWNKEAETDCILYKANVDGHRVEIRAYDSALPQTCKVITETVWEPARAAYQRTRTRVVCDQPVETT